MFYYYDSVFVKHDNALIVKLWTIRNETVVEGWMRFMHVLPAVINSEVGSWLDEWITLCVN